MKKKNLLDTFRKTMNPKASSGLTEEIRLDLDRYINDNLITDGITEPESETAVYGMFANALPPELTDMLTEEKAETGAQKKPSLPESLKADRPDHEHRYSRADTSVNAYQVAPSSALPKAKKKTGLPDISFTSGSFAKEDSLEAHLRQLDDSFSSALFKLIDARNMKDSDVYRKAGIDRRHFSKMRNADYHPGKGTVLALCIALSLSRDESDALLEKAGYALSKSSMQDLIVEYFIEQKKWDIDLVNDALYAYDQPLLGF